MKLRNVLVSILCLVLVAVIAVSGTVAYLQDDDSDVNVMTLGNVKIEQHEYERAVNADGTYKMTDDQSSYVLKDFTQAKPLLPATEIDANGMPYNYGAGDYDTTRVKMSQVDSHGAMDVFVNKNAQDKFVTVENTGLTDAYVRSIIALETGSLNEADFDRVIKTSSFMTDQGVWKVNEIGIVEIDNNNYFVYEYIYNGAKALGGVHENGILPAGDTTYPSLAQVYMTASATNEDVEAIDGNGNGTYDILVLSQAIQAANFENAEIALNAGFGKTSEKAAEWFGGAVIPVFGKNADAVDYVVDNGGKLFVENDITTDQITVDENTAVEIDLQENTLGGTIENNGELNVYDGALEATYIQNTGTANFTDVEIDAGSAEHYALITKNDGAVTVYKDVDVTTYGGGIGVADGAEAIFESGKVYVTTKSTSGRYVFYLEGAGSELTINGGEFSWDSTLNQKRAYVYAGDGTTVTINGGTFGPASTRSGYTAGIMGNGTVIIKGGTFGFDPSAWVADGYEAVQNGSTWTVSEK